MKKAICLLLTLVMLLLLCACAQKPAEQKPTEAPEAKIFVTVNTEGMGNIDTIEGETAPVINPEYPYQSTQINLAEPTVYTFLAWPQAGNLFVKWTKNGEDFSTEPQITVTLDESADFVAVFEDDADWQNPVMNFVGEYRCEKLHALVECMGKTEAWITIEQKESDTEATRWLISGKLNTDTLTISYTGSLKAKLVYDADGEVQSTEDEYEDGSGTVVFREDGSFLWHEDRAEDTEDRVFEWLPVTHAIENP